MRSGIGDVRPLPAPGLNSQHADAEATVAAMTRAVEWGRVPVMG